MGEPLRQDDPRMLGRFHLIERLGEGGQGIVYLGQDPQTGDRVAVKVLKAADAEARDRLEREMNAVQRVRRRFCIARVVDFDFHTTRPFVVSEYVDGPSLYDRVAEQGPLRDGALERLLVNTATALVAIHRSGVVHRDLKPANVLLGPDGPRVVDFGIARPVDQHTQSGQLVGTPSYFAPELLSGQKASHSSDVWAWACTMVFAATGYPPFGPFPEDGNNIAVILGRIMHAEPRLGTGLEEFLPLVRKCLDKDPARRPTARQIYDLLLESDLEVEVPAAPGLEAPPVMHPRNPTEPRRDETQFPEQRAPLPFEPVPIPETVPPRSAETIPPSVLTPPPFIAPNAPSYPPVPPAEPQRSRKGLLILLALVSIAALVAAGFLVFKPSDGEEDGVPASFAGTWRGSVAIGDGLRSRQTTTKVILYEGNREGEVSFEGDTLCTGILNLEDEQSGILTFDLAARTDCPVGKIRLSLEGSELSFDLTGQSGRGGSGTLKKE